MLAWWPHDKTQKGYVMSRPSISHTVTAKQSVKAHALPASAKNIIAKDGDHVLDHEDITARINFARHESKFIAEFRFRTRCGKYQSCTLPLTINSKQFKTVELAVHHAASRMRESLDNATDGHTLNARQKKAVAALQKWAATFLIAKPKAQQSEKSEKRTRFLDVFAGIGGFHQALAPKDAECAGVIELCPEARKTYQANHPGNYVVHDDIRTAVAEMFGDVDLICGGFPCQSLSIAGNQKGLADPSKSGLFFPLARLIGDLAPKAFILENVKALGSHDDGRTLDTVLDTLTDELGYAVTTCVLNAAEYGTAQKRERMFIVGIHDSVLTNRTTPFTFPHGTDVSVVVADILGRADASQQCKQPMERVKADPAEPSKKIEVVGLINGKNNQGYRVASTKGKGFTLCANSGGPGAKTGLYMVGGKPRRLTPRECARMQGFPETFQPHSRPGIARRQFGNSVAVPVVTAIAEQLTTSIR